MKNPLFLTCALVLASLIPSGAQPQASPRHPQRPGAPHRPERRMDDPQHKERWEAIQARKVAFFTDFVELNVAEAQKFWPAYKSFEKEIRGVMFERGRALRILHEYERDKKTLTNADAQKATQSYLDTFAKEGKLREKLTQELSAFLPHTRILKVFAAEEAFNNRLMREWAGGHDPAPGKGPGRGSEPVKK